MNVPIIADTSALISLLSVTDANNAVALRISDAIRQANRSLVLPGEVFTEMVNVVGKKVGHQPAIEIGEYLLASDGFLIVDTTAELWSAAFERFRSRVGSASQTDCLVMAIADQFVPKDIFGFDEVFQTSGYTRLGVDQSVDDVRMASPSSKPHQKGGDQ